MSMRESHDGNSPIRIPPLRPRRGRSLLRPLGLEDSAPAGLQYIEPPDDLTEDTPPTAIPGSFLITLAGEEDEDLDEASIEPEDEPTAERAVRQEASALREVLTPAPSARREPARPEGPTREWLEVEPRVWEPASPRQDRGALVTWAAVVVLVGMGLTVWWWV